MISTARRPEASEPTQRTGVGAGEHPVAHFREFCPVDSWAPAVNLYRLQQRLDVCVDLAGVEPRTISVRVEMSRLIVQGVRVAPEPPAGLKDIMCIDAMEIDHGPFCRTIPLSQGVDPSGVEVRYSKGLLWVHLPYSQTQRSSR